MGTEDWQYWDSKGAANAADMVDLDWGSRCSAATECEDPAAEDSNGPHWAEWVEEAENLLVAVGDSIGPDRAAQEPAAHADQADQADQSVLAVLEEGSPARQYGELQHAADSHNQAVGFGHIAGAGRSAPWMPQGDVRSLGAP